MGYIDSLNLYSFVVNNPINFVDPFGLFRNNDKPWWEKLRDGYYFGTGFGEKALEWYAQKWAETGNPIWAVPGSFAALWTPETYQATAGTLMGTHGIRNAGRVWHLRDGSPARTLIDFGNIIRVEKHYIGKGAAHALKWHIDAFGKLIKHWPWGI